MYQRLPHLTQSGRAIFPPSQNQLCHGADRRSALAIVIQMNTAALIFVRVVDHHTPVTTAVWPETSNMLSGSFSCWDIIFDNSNDNITYINNISETTLRVYPNPSNNYIYILGAKGFVNVYNMIGQKIYSDKNINTINISNWKEGIYFISSGKEIVKLVKQ